jgi:hypothetical protein
MGRPIKGFNDYEVRGNITAIIIYNSCGEKFEALVDTDDLPKLIDANYCWHVHYDKNTDSYYVASTGNKINRAKHNIYLQMFIMESSFENGKETVDHRNHNRLDNRKENLRVVEIKDNSKHRKGANKNNESGYRNVTWSNQSKSWIVQLWVYGKNKVWRGFSTPEEANEHAIKMRDKYYGEFSGNINN